MARNTKVVPESKQALDQWKYEIAAELGLPVGNATLNMNAEFASELGTYSSSHSKNDYWGNISARDTGAVGGAITARLIKNAENILSQGM